MISMAITTDGNFGIALLQKFFAMMTCLILGHLIGTCPVKIHHTDIRMTTAAEFHNLLFIWDTNVFCFGGFGQIFIFFCWVPSVALITKNSLLRMNTSFHFRPHIGMASNTGIDHWLLGPPDILI